MYNKECSTNIRSLKYIINNNNKIVNNIYYTILYNILNIIFNNNILNNIYYILNIYIK